MSGGLFVFTHLSAVTKAVLESKVSKVPAETKGCIVQTEVCQDAGLPIIGQLNHGDSYSGKVGQGLICHLMLEA